MSINRRTLVIAGASAFAAPAFAAPASLDGRWAGFYIYGFDPAAFANEATRVPFFAQLREQRDGFVGRTDEPNTFANPVHKRLLANLLGKRDAARLTFAKTYATGEVGHTVDYRGEVDWAANAVQGVWAIGGGDGGLWRMARRAAAIS